MKKVTILDIAAAMHLSRNTVAKALNGGKVTNETRMEVVSTALKMGYPKLDEKLIEELKQYRRKHFSGTIFVLYQKWEASRLTRIIDGISDKASEIGYRIQILTVDDYNMDPIIVKEQLRDDVCGIIFLGVFPNTFVKEICTSGVIATFYNTPVNAQDYIEIGDVFSLESFYSMNKLISHCIEIKHCYSFAFIGNAEGSRGIQARMLGFMSACNSHGIKINENYIYTRPEKEKYFDYNEVAGLLGKMSQIPDAIVCENDDVAKHVATWLYKNDLHHGLRTTITGFDNTIDKDFLRHDILSVEVRMEELGKRLVMSVDERVKNSQQDISFVTIATYPKLLY